MSMFSSPVCREVSKYTVEKLRSDFNFAGSINAHAQSIMGSAFQFGHHAVEGIDTIITSLLSPMCLSVNQQTRTFPTDPVLTFSAKENSRSFLAVDDGIDLDSVTDVDIGETTESKATKGKIKTEVEHSRSLTALADDVELDSFTDVAINETTEPKAKKSKIKTEVEENFPSTNCRLFLLIIQLRQCRKFAINELQIRL